MWPLVVFVILLYTVQHTVTGTGSFSNPYYEETGPITFTSTTKTNIKDVKPDLGSSSFRGVSTDVKQNISSRPFQSSELSFLEWNSQEHNKGIPLVEYFAFNFIESVKASERMQKAFQIQEFTAKSISSLVHDLVLNGHSSVGNPEPEFLAEIASRAVADNFHKVKEDSLLRVCAYYMGRFLFVRGVLTPSNVRSLAQRYFLMSKRSIDSVVVPTPVEYVTAIGKAMVDFLISVNLFTPFNTHMAAGGFANEWYRLQM